MKLPAISKNNIGAMTFLMFIILLSQSRIFDVLIDTALGRIVLISFLLILSYIHQMLGVVSVLIVILLFNNTTEGFKMNDNEKKINNKAPDIIPNGLKNKEPVKEHFDINVLATERTLQKGKQHDDMRTTDQDCDNMLPYDGAEAFTSF
jgi:hypothetical protein